MQIEAGIYKHTRKKKSSGDGRGYGEERRGRRERYTSEEIARHYGLGDKEHAEVKAIMQEACELSSAKHNISVSTSICKHRSQRLMKPLSLI